MSLPAVEPPYQPTLALTGPLLLRAFRKLGRVTYSGREMEQVFDARAQGYFTSLRYSLDEKIKTKTTRGRSKVHTKEEFSRSSWLLLAPRTHLRLREDPPPPNRTL